MKKGYVSIYSLRKNLFKIGQVCEMLGLTPRALRWYEKMGLIEKTRRSVGRNRLYSNSDLERIKEIKRLQAAGNSLRAIKELFKKKKDYVHPERKIKIFLDSTFSIAPQDTVNTFFEVLPMSIKFGYYEYQDYLTISPEVFGEIEDKKRILAESRPPSVEDYMKIFTQAIEDGYSQVVSLHTDSRIAGAYDNARKAKMRLGALPLEVVDTKLAGLELLSVWPKLKKDPENYQKYIKIAQAKCTEILVVLSLERFLPKHSENRFAGMIWDCIPVLQHTAADGLVPIARLNDVPEVLKYVKKHLRKFDKLIMGYSSGALAREWQTELKVDQKVQFSSVMMANLGRKIIGINAMYK